MKNQHHALESEKYMLEALRDDHYAARQQARANIGTAIWNFCIVAVAAVAGFYAVKTMPEWLPTVQTAFHEFTNYRYF